MALLKSGTLVASRYRVRAVLGRGGMGAVYRADDTRTGAVVALKALREDLYDREDLVRRFEREARAAARVGHESIVGVRAVGHDDAQRTRFIVQEYLRGADVAGCLWEFGRLPPRSAIAVTLPVMDALIAAHQAGIVHRDIKPENVFLHEHEDGRVVPKVIDFGIAKINDELERAERAATGSVVGTPWYMSPEQAQGSSLVDARTDVWSVGAMLYEMVCGALPFVDANPDTVMAQIIFGRPTPLGHHRPTVPADLQAIIHRAIERDLDRRYATMSEFRDALTRCQLWRDVTPADARALVPRPSSFAKADVGPATGPVEPPPEVRRAPTGPVPPPALPLSVHPPADPSVGTEFVLTPASDGREAPTQAPRRVGRCLLSGVGVALAMLGSALLEVGLVHCARLAARTQIAAQIAPAAIVTPPAALSGSTAPVDDR